MAGRPRSVKAPVAAAVAHRSEGAGCDARPGRHAAEADHARLHDPANPYVHEIANRYAFTTFGPVEWFDMIGRAPRPAHEAVWFQKWRVHRSLRREEFAGRVHNHLTGAFAYPLHRDVLASEGKAMFDESFVIPDPGGADL